MSHRTHRLLFVVVFAFLLIIPLELMVVPALLEERADEVSAARWVRLHAQELPNTLIDIKAFPMVYRKRIMRALPPETQAALWREHLQGYVQRQPGLDQSRIGVVRDAIEICVPGMFVTPKSEGLREAESALSERIKVAFSEEEAVTVFAQLGPEVSRTSRLEPLKLQLAVWLQRVLSPTLRASAPDCNCYNGIFDWCSNNPAGPTQHCSEISSCVLQSSGCGFFWSWECSGICKDGSPTP